MSAVLHDREEAGGTPADEARKADKAAFENHKLGKRLHRLLGLAIGDFNLIEPGWRGLRPLAHLEFRFGTGEEVGDAVAQPTDARNARGHSFPRGDP